MKITGHKTEAIYRRYAIVNEQDQRDALQKLEAHRAAAAAVGGGAPAPRDPPWCRWRRSQAANRLKTA